MIMTFMVSEMKRLVRTNNIAIILLISTICHPVVDISFLVALQVRLTSFTRERQEVMGLLFPKVMVNLLI